MANEPLQGEVSAQRGDFAAFPPREICIAGALAIAFGVNSVVQMIAGFLGDNFSLSIGFVGIPIGCGILIGRSSSRNWALLFSGISILQSVALVGILIYHHLSGEKPLDYRDGIYGAVEFSLIAGSSIYVFVVLKRKDHRAWFDSAKQPTTPVKSLAWTVAIITALWTLSASALKWWAQETLLCAFPVATEVTPYDAATGKGVPQVSIRMDPPAGSNRAIPSFPKITQGYTASRDGLHITLSGVATQPVRFKIVSQGYHDTHITITPDSEREIRTPMQPLHITVEPEKP